MDKKIKLDLLSVHVSVQIDYSALCAADSKAPKHMEYTYLTITFHLLSPKLAQLNSQVFGLGKRILFNKTRGISILHLSCKEL